jgi:ribonuclease-3
LGYTPRDRALFVVALTHRSAEGANNERLEFLGDSVLNLLLSERLYREFPTASEGDLSRLRSRLVSEEPLAEIAQAMQLGELLLLGSGELKTGGFRRQSILADAFEALCGALYLDGGLEAVRATIEPMFESRIAALPEPSALKDAKTRLQEHLQANGWPLPVYSVKRTTGEPHAQVFLVTCSVPHLSLETEGEGPSRRRAEQVAAQAALQALGLNV